MTPLTRKLVRALLRRCSTRFVQTSSPATKTCHQQQARFSANRLSFNVSKISTNFDSALSDPSRSLHSSRDIRLDFEFDPSSAREPIAEVEFHRLADDILHGLHEKIDEFGDDLEVDGFDSDFSDGVLTIRLGQNGTYVLNKQTPNRQIWLSSPLSGPARFDWMDEVQKWFYARKGVELVQLLEKELSFLLKAEVKLEGETGR